MLHKLDGKADPGTVAQLVRRGRDFSYCYKKEQPFVPQTPEETESLKAGDCEAKALWLASKLNDRNVCFVVGKARLESHMSHAWLIWNGPAGWMILDATLYSSPLVPARLSPKEFIPTYSYAPSGKYSHHIAATGGAKKAPGRHRR